ncbi:MAG: cation:dicarboxylase symporter family transporter [Spirochaetaceae bacterium]|jgi:proton glutamate symport protein|nr:cation:dicarboxylase symporter family transporter [Spirochaetaceae bacterium]
MKGPILKHPLTILAGVVLGTLIGLMNKQISAAFGIDNFAEIIAFPGQLYLFYLQMTVIPIILTAISSSLGKLIRNKSSAGLISKIVLVFLVCMFGCAVVGIGVGFFGKPGAGLDEDTRSLLAKLISTTDENGVSGALEINLGSLSENVSTVQRPSMASFFRDMIPSNVFRALNLGSTMAIVFFSIIFGIAIGSLPEEAANMLINMFSSVFQAFQKLIGWSLYLLPFGLVCLLAGQIASVGIQIFIAMSKFITLFCVGTAIIFLISTAVMWIRSGIANPFKVFSILFEPILLAFATRNSMATLPSAITCLDTKLGFNSNAVNLTLPLGMTLGRFGNIFYFGLAVFFVVQIYDMPLELIHYLIILIGVIFGGTATAGASGIVTLSMMSIVLDPLSLPLEAVLIIFMAIDPIVDPFRTFLIVYVNMVATTLVAKRDGEVSDQPLDPAGIQIKTDENPPEPALNPKITPRKSIDEELQLTGRYERISEAKQKFTVYVQEARDIPPILVRKNGVLQGMEIEFLKEIARRLNREISLKDAANLSETDQIKAKQSADLIAGVIKRTEDHPKGLCFSRSWAAVKELNEKRLICFLLPIGSPDLARIDGIIRNLRSENFLEEQKSRL